MKCTSDKVIQYAKSQVGYMEKNSNKYLDEFKKNAGSRNYTKYAEEFRKVSGKNLQGQPWCDMFVDTVFVLVFGAAKAKELLGGFEAYTPYSANNYIRKKMWFSKPCIGDQIFFKNSERINHTGIVTEVSDTKVYTIEGNTSDGSEVIENGGAVCEKWYWLSNPKIAGYGRPDYDNPYKKPSKTVTQGSSENDIKWLQFQLNKCLSALGSDIILDVDGKYGPSTIKEVLKLWEFMGLNKDGKDTGCKAGSKTINKLNKY